MNNRKIADASKASQHKDELFGLLEELDKIKAKVVLEIGVHRGYSMDVWDKALKPDILLGIENDMQFFDESLDRLANAVIEGDSNDPATLARVEKKLGGRKLDFLFIDGDHVYPAALNDWLMYAPLVRKGGIVAIHDVRRTGEDWIGRVETSMLFDQLKERFAFKEIWAGGPDDPGVGIIFI